MSSTPDEVKVDRLTVRLPSRELERLRELARVRQMDLASLGREAISAYLNALDPQAEQEKLRADLKNEMRDQADRIIERNEEVTRALIAALNDHLRRTP